MSSGKQKFACFVWGDSFDTNEELEEHTKESHPEVAGSSSFLGNPTITKQSP